jgi:hypothetical protein
VFESYRIGISIIPTWLKLYSTIINFWALKPTAKIA